MSEKITATIDKVCQETDCSDKFSALDAGQKDLFKDFTYCPYCAEEMTLVCNQCHEQLNSSDYKYCPWCGAGFTA